MRNSATLLLIMALLTTGCYNAAQPNESQELAAEVMTRVEIAVGIREAAGPHGSAVPEGCHTKIEIDEYGFEVEVVICDGNPTTTTSPVPTTGLTSWLESPDARSVATILYNVVILQQGCAGIGGISLLESLAANAPYIIGIPMADATSDLYRMAAACGSDATEWQRALTRALDDLDVLVALLQSAPNA